MLKSARSVTLGVLCGILGILGFSVAILHGGPSLVVAGSSGPSDGSVLTGALVVPGVDALAGGQQRVFQQRSALVDPAAIAERGVSRTAYRGLGSVAAAKLARESFPHEVNESASPPLELPPGQHVTRYLNDHAAQIDLGNGKRAVVESLVPIARSTSGGGRAAIDLTPVDAGDHFAPAGSPAQVRLPKTLADGVGLGDDGISLIPVSESGSALSGTGVVDGQTVFYANTQTDADTAVKPTTAGFETFALLRSAASPELVSFRVGMPSGAQLVLDKSHVGIAEVMLGDHPVARILAPTAHDAVGTQVPMTMSVSGDTLNLAIPHRAGSHQYPIEVDPEVIDTKLHFEWEAGNWGFETDFESNYKETESAGTLIDTGTGSIPLESWGLIRYVTQGQSRIYKFITETASTRATGKLTNVIEIINKSLVNEGSKEYLTNYTRVKAEVCAKVCTTSGGSSENAVFYEQVATTPEGSGFTATMYTGSVYIYQANGPTAGTNTTSPTLSGQPNILYTGGWMGPNTGAFEMTGTDPGVGISEWSTHAPAQPLWDKKDKPYCEGVQCKEKRSFIVTYYHIQESEYPNTVYFTEKNLPDGEDTVEYKVTNPMSSSSNVSTKVKVDATAPYEFTLTGLPPNKEIGNGQYHLKASAKDGSGTTLSSGVASLTLKVDGVQVGSPTGSCTPGPCTATGEWTVSGSEFGVGQHEVTVTATDVAANVGVSEKFTMYVSRPTNPLSVEPGTVDPQSGELNLSATDVSIAAPGGALTVSRGFGSLHLTAGSEGPLGPQWDMNLGGGESLTKLPNGDALLVDGTGLQAVYVSKGGGTFTSPTGDQTLVLTEKTVESKVKFFLKDSSGSTTVFALVSGGSGNVWMESAREEPNSLGTVSISYQVSGGITEPKEVLAPIPAGVTCPSGELKRGCRALTFNYAASTTATGEGSSQWGDYLGRLTRVYFTAWDPESAKMTTTTVAQYSYDLKGKLRAEWDPRISPALKTTYGYDSEGRVVALATPGQQPWLLTYGTSKGDGRTGRLLATTRPAASTAAGTGVAPGNTAAPAITGTIAVGNTLTVSNGTWSNSPLAYTYQWEHCNGAGAECVPVNGATNATYVVPPSAVTHKIVAVVTAINSVSATSANSAATAVVTAPTWYFMQFGSEGTGNGQFKGPAGVAVDSTGNVWVVDSGNNRIEKFEASGAFVAAYGSAGTGNLQFKSPTGIAINPSTNNVYVVDTGNNRVQKLDSAGKYVAQFGTEGTGSGQFKSPTGIVISTSESRIYVADTNNNRFSMFSLSTNGALGTVGTSGTGLGQFSKPEGLSYEEGMLYIADTGNNRIEDYYPALSTFLLSFGSVGSGNGQFSSPRGIAGAPLFIADTGNNRVQEVTEEGSYITQFGTVGSGYYGQFKSPKWIVQQTTGTYSGGLYVSDNGNNRIVLASKKIVPDPPVGPLAPPNPGTSAVTTIEYKVPVSGMGAPYAMGSAEVATWGETATPTEATALFPPDEPEGWPAQDYKRASIVYLDAWGRQINGASPGGAISTEEYNSSNEAVRVLSPRDRELALNEGAKSVEVSKLLDTQTTYSEDGTEVTGTLEPLHTVKLANGTTVEARRHTQYYYDEGAPAEGGPYRLVTKVTVGAQISGKPEEDVHTTTTAYNGQENLGWKLHKPTSVTADPSGLKLTQTTVYDANTGNVTETRTPGGIASKYAFKTAFGSAGTGNGQFKGTSGVAVDASGNVWATDSNNNRFEKFSATGAFIAAYGSGGSGNGQFSYPTGIAINQSTGNIYVSDEGNGRLQEFNSEGAFVRVIGSEGTGNAQFKFPAGLGIDSSGNVWVADSGNNRVQELNSVGTFVRAFGTVGTGNGQFKSPSDVEVVGTSAYVTDSENGRVEKFTTGGTYSSQFGSKGSENGQFESPDGIVSDPNTGNLYVADTSNFRIQVFSSSGTYIEKFGSFGSGDGQFSKPAALTFAGRSLYIADFGNNRVHIWLPGTQAADGQTIFYTAGANPSVPACGEHAEWESLPCETRPSEQPETNGVPNLPISTVTYNIWAEPLTTIDTVGTTTRTGTHTYDSAGRVSTVAFTSTVGTSLPTVKEEYNSETGALEKQSTTVGATTKTLTTALNKLGQATSYTDADEVSSTITYDIDGRAEKTNDGKGTQTFTYDSTTGLVTKMVDSAAGTFTAVYDVEGNLTTEGYPNGMNVNRTYDAAGTQTAVEYLKTTHCTEKCLWYSDKISPSIGDRWLSQTSTFSSQKYTYDNADRLTQVQDTPTGEGCTTRIYADDVETNRTGMTARSPGVGGACATEGGTTESHVYDSANRLLDAGVTYDTFGNITKLPAADAGGNEVVSTYYVDNTLATQAQGGQTLSYYLDPAGRPRETVSSGIKNSTVISHYAGQEDTPTWTVDGSGNWTRYITGIGGFAATQYNGESAILQIENLHGDIVATASISETATALSTTNEATEYGVPRSGNPPKFSWLGGEQRSTELGSGIVAMGARSYVPQLGRFLQTDPVAGGSANSYSYVFGDPVNESDPSGEYSPGWFSAVGGTVAKEVLEAEAAREAATRLDAEAKAMVVATPSGGGRALGPRAGGDPVARTAGVGKWLQKQFKYLIKGCMVPGNDLSPSCRKYRNEKIKEIKDTGKFVKSVVKFIKKNKAVKNILEAIDRLHTCEEGGEEYVENVQASINAATAENPDLGGLYKTTAFWIGCEVAIQTDGTPS